MMSPKARFLTSPQRVAEHKHLVSQPIFLDAIDSALLQYGNNLDARGSAGDVSNGVLQRGAREFVQVLLSLADTATVTPRRDPDNLKNV